MIFEADWCESDFKVLDATSPAYREWLNGIRLANETRSLRTDLVGGFDVTIAWGDELEAVWMTRNWVSQDDGEEELGYVPEEDSDGLMALLHPHVICRLICNPIASMVLAGDEDLGAVATNNKGVTFGDVLYALAKQ